jgi:hypothetical protein
MQKVNGWPAKDHSKHPANHGKQWSSDHTELAERKLREGWSVSMVADAISRQPSAVISKLEKLGVIRSNDYGVSYYFAVNAPSPEVIYHKSQGCTWKEAKEYAEAEKEPIMTNHVFETKTFIDGKDVASYSGESLLNMADKVVTRMTKLEAISTAYASAADCNASGLALTALQSEFTKLKETLVKLVNLATEKLSATDSSAE